MLTKKFLPFLFHGHRTYGNDHWCAMCGRPEGEVVLGTVNVKPYSVGIYCEFCWNTICDYHDKMAVKTLIQRFVQDPLNETQS